jgi:multiple sugar transport system substrate-binding protein
MYDTGRWPQAQFKKVDGLQFGTVLPPMDAQTKKRVTVLHEAGFCINPASKYKADQAWELVKFESGAEAQTIRTEAGWALPALPEVVKALDLTADPLEKTWFEAVPFATVAPCFMRTSQWDPANSELQNAVDSIFLGKATAAEAMGVATPIVDGILAEA